MIPDMKDIGGMPEVIAAVEKSVATKKPLLLCGPPGIGKTMVARRIPGIMPDLTEGEIEALYVIYARANLAPAGEEDWWRPERPFRCPHHTVSMKGLIGSVRANSLGELELAAYGVLFLDDLPEFATGTIKLLGEKLHAGGHHVHLVASSNPCPCGWNGYPNIRTCMCGHDSVFSYQRRVQGLARMLGIEDFVDIAPITLGMLREMDPGENSAAIKKRILEEFPR